MRKIPRVLAATVTLVTLAALCDYGAPAMAAKEPECPLGTHFVFNIEIGQGKCEPNGTWTDNGTKAPEKLSVPIPTLFRLGLTLKSPAGAQTECQVAGELDVLGANSAQFAEFAPSTCSDGSRLTAEGPRNPGQLGVTSLPWVLYVGQEKGAGRESAVPGVKLWLVNRGEIQLEGTLNFAWANGIGNGLTPSHLEPRTSTLSSSLGNYSVVGSSPAVMGADAAELVKYQ